MMGWPDAFYLSVLTVTVFYFIGFMIAEMRGR